MTPYEPTEQELEEGLQQYLEYDDILGDWDRYVAHFFYEPIDEFIAELEEFGTPWDTVQRFADELRLRADRARDAASRLLEANEKYWSTRMRSVEHADGWVVRIGRRVVKRGFATTEEALEWIARQEGRR